MSLTRGRLSTQGEPDALPVRAIVQGSDDDACQKDEIPRPLRNSEPSVPLWFIAGREEPQLPALPAAVVWVSGMTRRAHGHPPAIEWP